MPYDHDIKPKANVKVFAPQGHKDFSFDKPEIDIHGDPEILALATQSTSEVGQGHTAIDRDISIELDIDTTISSVADRTRELWFVS